MKLLRELTDKDIGLSATNDEISYFIRKAARTVLFDQNNRIVILAVTKDGYHKLPGGGIESGEDINEALIREVKEEVGAEITVTGEIGCILEYRNEFNQIQMSYCYMSKLTGSLTMPDFTESELNNGFELRWCSIEEAIELMKEDQPRSYVGKFINARDSIFLEEAINHVSY